MIAFALYMPRARLARRFIWPSGLFIWSYGKHTPLIGAQPITYGNGRARLTFFLSLSLSLSRARARVALVSSAFIATGNRRSITTRTIREPSTPVFSTFYLPLTRGFLPPLSLSLPLFIPPAVPAAIPRTRARVFTSALRSLSKFLSRDRSTA